MDKVLKFLKENVVCTLATCSNNKPRASAMEYGVVGDHVIFATQGSSIKALNLKANNKISFSAYAMPRFLTIDGTTAAADAQEIEAYTGILFARHPEFKELAAQGLMQPFTYYKLIPELIYYNDFSNGMAPVEIIKP